MELRTIRYFLAVAEQESFSAAANNVLFVTQPTLSRQMQELEEELGVQLFVRSNKKTTLTEEGLRFRKRAQEIMELVGHTEKEFAEASKEEIVGDVYIGGGETKAFSFIAAACKRMQAKHPKIRMNITSGNAQDVTEKLDQGLLDFGLLAAFAQCDCNLQPDLQRLSFCGAGTRSGIMPGRPFEHRRQEQARLRAVHAVTHQRSRGGMEKESRVQQARRSVPAKPKARTRNGIIFKIKRNIKRSAVSLSSPAFREERPQSPCGAYE